MLNTQKVVAFVPSADAAKARSFYEGIVGLRVLSEDRFALVLDANGTMLRVTNVQNFKPQQFTILGWDVTDLDEAVSYLNQRGVASRTMAWRGRMSGVFGHRPAAHG